MQISLTSHLRSLRFNAFKKLSKGFTLVEIIIVVAIISILSAIIIPRYLSFDSSTLLSSTAYEVAASIRQAQVYSLSVRGATSLFDYPFGISFSTDSIATNPLHNIKNYILYQFENDVKSVQPVYDESAGATVVLRTPFERTMQINDLCIKRAGIDEEICTATRLDIAFRRPEFEAIFHTEETGIDDDDIEVAYIKLGSAVNANEWTVRVGLFGDISVYKEP